VVAHSEDGSTHTADIWRRRRRRRRRRSGKGKVARGEYALILRICFLSRVEGNELRGSTYGVQIQATACMRSK
jgi:hypothetical protein